MANTYIKIASGTISSLATSYTISSIPSTYSVIKLVLVTKCTAAAAPYTGLRLNGVTAGGSYIYSQLYADTNPNTQAEFTTASQFNIPNSLDSTNQEYAPCEITITNAQTTSGGFSPSLVWQCGYGRRANGLFGETMGWGSNANISNSYISSITVIAQGGNIALNSTWQLYGLE